jgi:hypothetical protein
MRQALCAATAAAAAISMAAAPGVSDAAAGSGKQPRSRPFTTIAVGATISTTASRFEKVYRVKRSPDGGGGAIQDGALAGTTFPVSGHDTMELFFRNGLQMTADTFTLGAPAVDGVGAIAGTGHCTHGTGAHKGETCSFKISGTYNLQTTVTMLRFAGTFTR